MERFNTLLQNLLLIVILLGFNILISFLISETKQLDLEKGRWKLQTTTLHKHFNTIMICLFFTATICYTENLAHLLFSKDIESKFLLVFPIAHLMQSSQQQILDFIDFDITLEEKSSLLK
jgi:hypothetical protein